MRGIVISPKFEVFGTTIGFGFTGIEGFDLRKYLMYWDKLDFPNNSALGISSTPDIDFLEKCGVLQRTFIQTKGNLEKVFPEAQLSAFRKNNKKEPGCWSLAQSTSKLNLLKEDVEQSRVLEVELYQCLPVPTEDVSLDEILEFKQRRNDELLEFRFLMDRLYLDTIEAGDFERARTHNIELLQKKIVDIDRLMNESMISRIKTNLSANIDISDVLMNSIAGASAGAFVFGMPDLGALAGFASSFVKLGLSVSLKPKDLPEGLRDYAYLYHAKRELG
ncbi:DUF6236 family protein [Bacillus sp. FSL K6-6483]